MYKRQVLGAVTRKDGYLEGGGWLVSWCLGHLAGLADAATYNPDYAKWRYDDLPILPESWRFTIAKDKRCLLYTSAWGLSPGDSKTSWA